MYVRSGWIVLEQRSSLVPGLVLLHICPLVAETGTQVEFVAPEMIVCVFLSTLVMQPSDSFCLRKNHAGHLVTSQRRNSLQLVV